MKTNMLWLIPALLLGWGAQGEAQAQAQSRTGSPGVGFQMATRIFSPSDARFAGGSNVFRITMKGEGNMNFFFERETLQFTFLNSGSGATSVSGVMQAEGVGIAYGFGESMSFELTMGRASTTSLAGVLVSSDMLMDLGFHWVFRSGRSGIDLGLIYRSLPLAGGAGVLGTALGGGTGTDAVDDLGGLLLNVGIGYAF